MKNHSFTELRQEDKIEIQSIIDQIASIVSEAFVVLWLPTSRHNPEKLEIVAQKGLLGSTDPSKAQIDLKEQKDPVIECYKQGVSKSGEPSSKFHLSLVRTARWKRIWCFPIVVSEIGLVSGVLSLYPVGEGLTAREQQSAEIFCNTISTTLERIHRTQVLESLYQISNELVTTSLYEDERTVVENIVDLARDILEVDEVTLHQYDEAINDWLDVKKYSITSPRRLTDDLTKPRPTGETARVLREGNLFSEDRVKDGLEKTSVAGRYKATMSFRLEVNQEKIGVLHFNYKETRGFSKNDRYLAKLFSTYASTAIYNHRVYSKNVSRLEGLQVLLEIGQNLTQGIRLKQDEILELIFEQTSRLMDTRELYIALFEPDSDDPVKGEVSFGLVFEGGERINKEQYPEKGYAPRREGKGITEAVIRNKKPLFLQSATAAKEWYGQPEHKEYTGYIPEKFSLLGVPMMTGEKVLGVIAVQSEADHVYNEDHATTLMAIATQAAIALDNADLFYNVNQQLRTVLRSVEVAKECKTLDELLQTYLKFALEQIESTNGTIQLIDSSTGNLVVRATVGDVQQRKYQIIPKDKGITGRALREKQMVYVPDVQQDLDYLGYFEETRCELAMPLMVNDEPFGVLNAEDSQIDAFDKNSRNLFRLFASQASVLIQERMQLEEAKQKQIQAEVNASVAEMTHDVAHRIKNLLGGTRADLHDIMEKVEFTVTQHEKLSKISDNMKVCIDISNRLFSPYEQLSEKALHSPKLLVQNAVGKLRKPSDVVIDDQIPDALPGIYIDGTSAVEHFYELIINATKAIDRSLQTGKITQGKIELRGKVVEEGRIVQLLFINNGPPIPRNSWEDIFNKFYKPEEGFSEGSGLGLWGGRTFFRRYGGDIRVVDSNEKQTVFVVSLPTKSRVD